MRVCWCAVQLGQDGQRRLLASFFLGVAEARVVTVVPVMKCLRPPTCKQAQPQKLATQHTRERSECYFRLSEFWSAVWAFQGSPQTGHQLMLLAEPPADTHALPRSKHRHHTHLMSFPRWSEPAESELVPIEGALYRIRLGVYRAGGQQLYVPQLELDPNSWYK